MVITVTLNPALDKTLLVENFNVGEVNRVKAIRCDIGGKGINVSKVLREFDVKSLAMGFLGDNLEKAFKDELRKRDIQEKFVSISSDTRTNIKLVDTTKNTFTDINEPGGEIKSEELEKFKEIFLENLAPDDVVVLSGGVSEGVPKTIYKDLTEVAKNAGASVVVDAEGDLFKEAIKAKPDLVKPNNFELEKLMGETLDTEEKLIDAASKLVAEGVGKVLVSLGKDGSIYVTKEKVYRAYGLEVPVKSTVGAGDSMVAAMVYSSLNGFDDLKTLAMAQSAGAASVMLEGTKACNLKQAEDLLEEALLKIKEV
ncbi:1-phosphofructokinase [Alkalibacter mobilis]|uniref:1-phosphofructokinase n=1 Tax=Alkalibacter mobilis TaxID=2787712 RepID=UPI0018A04B22|nr:1-phosphofructokinase [Alkalibacter mobilis]